MKGGVVRLTTNEKKLRQLAVDTIISWEGYTEANGKVIRDTITLNGDDWLFTNHKIVDTVPTEEDFRKTVSAFLSWKVKCLMENNL